MLDPRRDMHSRIPPVYNPETNSEYSFKRYLEDIEVWVGEEGGGQRAEDGGQRAEGRGRREHGWERMGGCRRENEDRGQEDLLTKSATTATKTRRNGEKSRMVRRRRREDGG